MDIEKWIRTLPVLKSEKNPTTALVVGFLFGGIGLAIYFRKIIDFFIPIFAYIILAVLYSQFRGQGELYVAAGAVVAACYGYLRAKSSNEMLRQGRQAPAGPSFATPGAFCAACGHHLDPADAFCPSCGAHVSQPAPFPPQGAPFPQQAAPFTPQAAPVPQQAAPVPQQAAPVPQQAAPVPQQAAPAPQPADWWTQAAPKSADSDSSRGDTKPWW